VKHVEQRYSRHGDIGALSNGLGVVGAVPLGERPKILQVREQLLDDSGRLLSLVA
jgi:hypothetical protein